MLLLGLSACSSSSTGVAGDAGPVSGGITVQPSAVSQTVSQGGVSVTIPGGLLSAPSTLVVAPSATAAQLAKPTPDTAILGAYDISLGTTSTFDKPITIEIPYDPAKLDPDSPEGKNLWVSSWDPTTALWSIPPIDVDTVRKVITVRTYHLSTWIYWTLQGYKYVDSTDGAFEVYYHPDHAQPRLDVGGMTPAYTMRDLATDTAVTLSTAKQAYDAANFTVPSGQVKAIITDAGNSNMDPYSGNIFLDRREMTDLALLMHDAAHELFHVVQNQYLNIWGMARRRWWIEGTPDYAASVVAWDDPTTLPPFIATYFSDSFTASTENDLAHCYQNSQFVHYLVSRRGLDFEAMWNAVATNSVIGDNGFPALQKFVAAGTGDTFDQVWVAFVDYALFGPGHPMPVVQTTSFKLTDAVGQGSRTVLTPSYGAQVVMMEAAPVAGKQTRSVKVSASGMASGTTVEIWQAASRDQSSAILTSVLVDNSSSWSVDLTRVDTLYAVVHNTGSAERSVTVTAVTTDVADAGVEAGVDAGKDAGTDAADAGADASAGKWTLQVVFKGTGNGQVLGSGTTCTATCTYTRDNASDLTLIPYPDSLSGFIGWDVISCTKGTATFNPYGCSAYFPECTSFYATDGAVCSIGANFALK